MRDAYTDIVATGANLVVIGNGEPWHAKAFQTDESIPFPLWVDPDMMAYRAAGLRRGVTSALSVRTLGHALRARRSGARQSAVQGDPWQLGGAFVITAAGNCVFSHVSREAGDHPTMTVLLSALRNPAK